MKIIEIVALDNGAHRNQNGSFKAIPDGWAVVPENLVVPDTFPFVDITVKDGIVTSMTAGVVPEPEVDPEPVEEVPSQMNVLEAQVMYTAMMTDTLIEG